MIMCLPRRTRPKETDGGRQQRTACPLLCRYSLKHTYCSLARLPTTHPFVGAPILQRHFQVRWRARRPPPPRHLPHTSTQDGWFMQPNRRTARLPRRTLFSRCRCRCSTMRARLPLHILLLYTQVSRRAHTYRGYASFSDICGACFGFGSGFGIGFTLLLARSFTQYMSFNVPLPLSHTALQ
jgi:hypothetical protein